MQISTFKNEKTHGIYTSNRDPKLEPLCVYPPGESLAQDADHVRLAVL